MKTFVLLVLLSVVGPVFAFPWQGFTALELSQDGRTFATGGKEGQILWLDVATGEILASWSLTNVGPIVGVAFDSEGKLLAAVSLGGHFILIDLDQKTVKTASIVPGSWESLTNMRKRWLTASPLSSEVRIAAKDYWASGNSDGQITIGSLSTGAILRSWSAHESAVTGAAWVGDGQYLLSCSYDGSLCRWDAQTGKLLGRL